MWVHDCTHSTQAWPTEALQGSLPPRPWAYPSSETTRSLRLTRQPLLWPGLLSLWWRRVFRNQTLEPGVLTAAGPPCVSVFSMGGDRKQDAAQWGATASVHKAPGSIPAPTEQPRVLVMLSSPSPGRQQVPPPPYTTRASLSPVAGAGIPSSRRAFICLILL